MHYVGFVDTEDMNVTSGKKKYTSLVGYSGSKLAEVILLLFLFRSSGAVTFCMYLAVR